MRKEDAWGLSVSNSDAATKGTPRTPRTPGSGAGRGRKKAVKTTENGGDDDSEIESPSKAKKENLKKTVSGRVTKNGGRAAKSAVKSYEESDAETEFMDADTGAIKTEGGMMDWGHSAAGEDHGMGDGFEFETVNAGYGDAGYGDAEGERFYDDA
ncbi:hypothetical protein ACMFMF_000404 [Clarireedia jacksonii]